ncbi:MAG: vWA domain-containing protein [Polyangiales bacterium]
MLRRFITTLSILVLPAACSAKGDDTSAAHDSGVPAEEVSIKIPETGVMDSIATDVPFDACVSQSVAAKQVNLAMLVLIDHSGSMMDLHKWESASKAIRGFVDRKETAGLDVGLTFFPPLSATTDGCSYSSYEAPAVPIASLPGNVLPLQKALLESGDPNGGTPMQPALRGAIASVRDYVAKTPNTEGVVILVTDGDPSACGTIAQVAAEAKAGVTGPLFTTKVRTFVVGMDGATFANLDLVAGEATTGTAFNVGSGYAAADSLLSALDDIRVSALGCDYLLESPGPTYRIEYDQVSVGLTPEPGAMKQTFGRVANQDACTETKGGFYYDNNDKPTRIKLCEASCKIVQAAPRDTAKLDIDLGCLKVVM